MPKISKKEFNKQAELIKQQAELIKQLQQQAKQSKSKFKRTEYLGRTYRYNTLGELQQRLMVDKNITKIIASNVPLERIIYNKDNEVEKIDLRDKPTILKRFGVKKINREKIFNNDIKLNSAKLLSSLPIENKVDMFVVIRVKFAISNIPEVRIFKEIFDGYLENIKDETEKIARQYVDDIGNGAEFISYKVVKLLSKNDKELEIEDYKLRQTTPLNIFNEYINIELNSNKDCAISYLLDKLPNLEYEINQIPNINGVKINDLSNFLRKYKIPYKMYRYNGKIIDKYNEKSRKCLVFICYDNHLFPCNNKYLQKVNIEEFPIKIIDDSKKMISDLLNENIIAGNIEIAGSDIVSFTNNNIRYIENAEYNKCKEILKKFGLEDKVHNKIKIPYIFSILENVYIKENIDSFWIDHDIFKKSGFIFQRTIKSKEGISTIDKNKMYPYCLQKLRFLISTDYRTNKITKNPTEIVDHNLYLVKPKQSSILIENTNIYTGEHLKFCISEGFKLNEDFTLLEEITTNKYPNYYRKMINDMYENISSDDFKLMCNISIGKFECMADIKRSLKPIEISRNKEKLIDDSFKIDINSNFSLLCEEFEKITNLYNRKPIAIQIKDESKRVLYEKMKEMNLKTEDIIKIKVDSITYYGKLPKGLDKDDLYGWKETKTEIDDLKDDIPIDNEIITTIINNPNSNAVVTRKQKSVLAKCYAGAGKTYYIKNTLVKDMKDFIILSPTHISLREFKKIGLSCNVIQTFTLSHTIPKEKNIIIDEVGMCDKEAHDLIFKMFLLGKNIYCFGDFNQLPNVKGEEYSSIHYLNYLFDENINLDENRRNHFTREYYDSLINETVNIKEEVRKHQTTYDKADVVICWRNSTVDEYNKKIMKERRIKKYDEGLTYLCYTNKFQDKGLYNKFEYTIKETDEETVTFDNDITIKKTYLLKYFKPNFARTVYCVQGDSFKSYHFAEEDEYFLDGRIGYVVISRLLTK
jgi:hypothetical protein